MKQIFLAKKSKRMLARLIDFVLVTGITLLLFMFLIFPLTFNQDQYLKNNQEAVSLYNESGLFVVDESDNYRGKSSFNGFNKIEDLYSKEVTFENHTYTIQLTKSLFEFYTQKYTMFDGQKVFSLDTYKQEILKLNTTESNIKAYDEMNHTFTLMDDSKANDTISYFTSVYTNTSQNIMSSSIIKNEQIMFHALSFIVPTLLGISFIFDLIIPLCMPNGETLGKKIMHLGLVSKDGYELKKYFLIPRFLSYIFIEYILGIVTFGGTFLISYTMFLFVKKRRCIHDFLSNSVVIDKDSSIIFKDAKEEAFYLNRQKTLGATNETN